MKYGITIFLVTALLFLASLTPARTEAAPLTRQAQKEATVDGRKVQAALRVQVSAAEITVADSLELTIEVMVPKGLSARMPTMEELGFAKGFNGRSQRFRLTDLSEPDSQDMGDNGTRERQTYTLSPWLSGDYAILPVMVSFYKDKDTASTENKGPALPLFSLMTDGLRIKVTPLSSERRKLSPIFGQADPELNNLFNRERRLENKSDEELRRDKEAEKEAQKALSKRSFPWWIFAVILAVILITGTLWYIRKRHPGGLFKRPAPPPHVRAAQEFAALEKKGLLEKGLIKEFYYELSYILRGYIGGRFGIYAKRQTTEEFFRELLDNNPFDSMAEQILREFSERADTVKYSLFRPDTPEAQESLGIAKAFVDNTAIKEEGRTK